MANLQQSNAVSVTLLPGQVLTVVADSVSSGGVSRLGDNPGELPQGHTAISASSTTVKGPFPGVARFLIECAKGALTWTLSQLDVADYVGDAVVAVKAAAVAPLTDSSGGTPGATLAAVGATNTGDRSADINNNFASLNEQIEDLKEAFVNSGLLTAYVAP
jgi:hypothetical protein